MKPDEKKARFSREFQKEEEGLVYEDKPEDEDPKPDENKREHVHSVSYFTLFRFSSTLDKVLIGVAIIAAFIIGAIVPFSIKVVADVFQIMINYETSKKFANADSEKFLHDMHTFGITYSCIGLVIFIGAYLSSSLMTLTAGNQIFRLRIAYLKAALNQDFAYFDTHQTGDFAAKMAQDVVKMEEGIGDKVTSLVTNLTTAIGCVAMAIIQGWKLALLCLTSTPLSFLLVGITGKLSQYLARKGAIASGKASSLAEEVLSSIRTVYTFNGQQKEIEHYRTHLAEARKTHIWKAADELAAQAWLFSHYNFTFRYTLPKWRLVLITSSFTESSTGLTMGLVSCSVFFSYALSFYLGVRLIITDPQNYNASVMFAVFFGILLGTVNLGMTAPLISSFGSARGAAAYIFHLLNNVPTINPQRDEGIRPVIEGNIKLKNVDFHYPNRDVSVLSDMSLLVNQGQSVALVGPSGCGKSTIIQLISRFYDVDSGHVYVDGHDVQNLSVRWLRAHIGLVGQEPVLFDTTVRENIRYGREDATDQEVEEAAKQANAHHFIMNLPQKYETHVGEGGASLSGGQKQRIAIARALVRNPVILLLDEATSALDSASEAKVQLALTTASKGRTTITVAHRLSTIRNVDLIYVMKAGKITETGTHDELMQKKGLYYDMVTVQEPVEDVQQKKKVPMGQSEIPHTDSKISMKTDDELDFEENLKKLKKMSFLSVMLLNLPEWKSLAVGITCATIMGFSQPLFILAFGNLFGEMSNPNLDELMAMAKSVAIICVGIGLVFFFASFCESVAFGIAGGYLVERLRFLMFEHMLRQPVAYFDKPDNSTGALCARLSSEATNVESATGERVGSVCQAFGAISLALILAFTHEWQVALVLLAFLPLVALVVFYEMKATKLESVATIKSLERSTKVAIEAVSNIRTVASLGREPRIIKTYEEHLRPALKLMRRSAQFRGLVEGLSRSLYHFMNSTALVYGGHRIVSHGVKYENLLITTQSLQMATNTAQNAFGYISDFHKGSLAASRIVAMLRLEPAMRDPKLPAISPFVSSGSANFKDVHFRYPTRRGQKVLNGLERLIEPGKTIAVVGESGCGKSTIIKLLERYYDPEKGVVALDDIPIPNLLMSEVRANLGLVSQEPVLFQRTIWENIAYGDNTRVFTQVEIEAAAKSANIHGFIITLPKGYHTNLGTKGLQLSGGQKQRVAIARALIRKPQILLLDEATSALDTESEKVVQDALDKAKEGRTCVMIAHRLSTVRDADAIGVMQGGRLVEQGSHDALMAAKGHYYELHRKM